MVSRVYNTFTYNEVNYRYWSCYIILYISLYIIHYNSLYLSTGSHLQLNFTIVKRHAFSSIASCCPRHLAFFFNFWHESERRLFLPRKADENVLNSHPSKVWEFPGFLIRSFIGIRIIRFWEAIFSFGSAQKEFQNIFHDKKLD